jgi:hypothetical protein
MKLKYKVLLVHTPFELSEGVSYLSAGIRLATNSHWNHIAIEVRLYGKDWIIEAVGAGVIITKKEDWLVKSNRDVLIRVPKELTILSDDLLDVIGDKYGYLDLLQIAIFLFKRRVVDSNYEWDGKSIWNGWFCSELLAWLEKREKPYLITPSDYEFMDGYETLGLLKTYKK